MSALKEPFLGIKSSCTGRKWMAREYEERTAQTLAQRQSLPDLISRCLASRGIEIDEAEDFLDPKLRNLLPDPYKLADMQKAAQRFADAICKEEKIAIFGDYDVDGATSSALLTRFAAHNGIKPRLYIPDRFLEGYGPNTAAMKTLAKEKITLTVFVDCGTTAYEALEQAANLGIDAIVIDHHASEAELPKAIAVVNPNRLDENGKYGNLAAVGVAYLFVIATNRILRTSGFYDKDKRTEPDVMQWLDLVALGTICDVVSLKGLNRAFAAQGMKIAAHCKNTGIKALAEVTGITKFDAYAAGFILGPRINAGGRIGASDLGAKLLSTDDKDEAAQIAKKLHDLNAERRAIEADILKQAEKTEIKDAPLAFVASDNWHSGVIGIVASRLKDRFQRPALVIAIKDGIGKGSGRSIGNIDLGSHIIAARQAGLLINGGGHKMAAGFTVDQSRLNDFRSFMIERISKHLETDPISPTLSLDGLASGANMTAEFARQIEKLSPFGAGNSEPRFAFADCNIVRADIVGEKHVSVIFSHGGVRSRGIAFRAMESDLGQCLLKTGTMHLAGRIRLEEWQGTERLQLHIDDAAKT